VTEILMRKPDLPAAGHYDANYKNFQTDVYAQIRLEAFGEDIGQNSWLTADELDKFIPFLDLCKDKKLLDVACGAGGPALRIAALTGCSVVSIDLHEDAIAAGRSMAIQRGLSERCEFRAVNATGTLLFQDSTFDAIVCIDAINHFPERPSVIAEWVRVLKVGGRLLFTDPITVTRPLTNHEIAVRSSAGFYLFVPAGYNESLLKVSGLQLLLVKDVTANMANVAEARLAARASRSTTLREIEGDAAFDRQQEFLTIAARVAKARRLSRFAYVAKKVG